jgi:hypothetical protein
VDGARLRRGWHIDAEELGPSTPSRKQTGTTGLLIDLNHWPEKESLKKNKKLEKVRRGRGD